MDILARKTEFVREFLKLDNEEIIAQFEELLHIVARDFKPMSVEELYERIDKSEEDFSNDRYKSATELLAKYRL